MFVIYLIGIDRSRREILEAFRKSPHHYVRYLIYFKKALDRETGSFHSPYSSTLQS